MKKIIFFTYCLFSITVHLAQVFTKNDLPLKRPVNGPGLAFSNSFFIPQLNNKEYLKQLLEKANKKKEFYEKNPGGETGFVLFNAAPQNYFDTSGRINIFGKRNLNTRINFDSWPALRFNIDDTKSGLDSFYNAVFYYNGLPDDLMEPFYFEKSEITNAMYRQFTNYVRDSIARTILARNDFSEFLLPEGADSSKNKTVQRKLNWKTKLDWNNEKFNSIFDTALWRKQNERFYAHKEIDGSRLKYVFTTAINNETITKELNVMPDTASWVYDFTYSFNEPMTNMYYWHAAYDNYPVVGITWWQAKAYLNWRTELRNKYLASQKKPYRVKYDLPTETEWQIAASSFNANGKPDSFSEQACYLTDNSWICDLSFEAKDYFVDQETSVTIDSVAADVKQGGVFSPQDEVTYDNNYWFTDSSFQFEKDGRKYLATITKKHWKAKRMDFNYSTLNSGDRFFGTYILDGFFHTAPVQISSNMKTYILRREGKKNYYLSGPQLQLINQQLDVNGISFMGGNVSEWLNEDYTSYETGMKLRLKYLQAINSPDATMRYQLEKYYDDSNCKTGKLVRGSNWFDERFSLRLGKNYAGMSAKKFVNPDTARCTIGFRSVIHVFPAE